MRFAGLFLDNGAWRPYRCAHALACTTPQTLQLAAANELLVATYFSLKNGILDPTHKGWR
jgi:hypothetical protein